MCLDKAIEALLVSLSLTLHCNRPGRAITLESDVQEFLESRFFADAGWRAREQTSNFDFQITAYFAISATEALASRTYQAQILCSTSSLPNKLRVCFQGSLDPITAFMESRLRANGHLIRVFQLFAAFSRGDANSV
jgi:hypothetical protein